MQHVSYDVVLVEFVAEKMPGLNFCTHCALSIDEVNEVSQNTTETRHKLKLLKCIRMWSSK